MGASAIEVVGIVAGGRRFVCAYRQGVEEV